MWPDIIAMWRGATAMSISLAVLVHSTSPDLFTGALTLVFAT
jgi:hypothetical protein